MSVKEQVFQMHDLISDLVESTDALYAGFIYDNVKVLREAEDTVRAVAAGAGALTRALVQEVKAEPPVKPYVSVPSHIERMGENMAGMFEAIRRKISGNILFSDKAVDELDYMFERIRDILLHCRDMVLARNVLVARHIVESARAIERMADDYATKHEERLIEGLCAPGASVIFLELLDAIKGIAWHAGEIAKDLAR